MNEHDPAVDDPFYRLLATKYEPALEDEALRLLQTHPELARRRWPGPDDGGTPFVRGSTALHYAANDGKLRLMSRLIDLGADPNACDANWFRSVLAWAANNARLEALRLLLARGAAATSLDALHAAAWGGSSAGKDPQKDYAAALAILLEAGADVNDTRHHRGNTPLDVARDSGNVRAQDYLVGAGGLPGRELEGPAGTVDLT